MFARARRTSLGATFFAAFLLMAAVPGGSQRENELIISVHAVWKGNFDVHGSQARSSVDETDQITITFDARVDSKRLAGTPPWEMDTLATDYHVSVEGGGSGVMRVTDTSGSTRTFNESWTWVSANPPPGPVSVIELQPGSFHVQVPIDLNALKIEPRGSASQAKDIGDAMIATIGVLAVSPKALLAAEMSCLYGNDPFAVGRDLSNQLTGTYDQNAKSFSRSGHAAQHCDGSKPIPGGSMSSSLDLTYSINFNSNPEDVEAVVIPADDYGQWIPEAGDDEGKPGNALALKVVLEKKGEAGSTPNKRAKFKFELVDVSQEPGVCLNWPQKSQAQTTRDLKIDANWNTTLKVADDGQSAESAEKLTESGVVISSYDWGGWGKVKVTATLDDDAHTQLVAHLKDKPDIEVVSIPKDDNGNHIADYWEQLMAPSSTAAEADDDLHPKGNGDDGDALSLYEEYRGFMIHGEHFRTDPKYKDVFVYDSDQLTTGSYAASGLDVHVVDFLEINFDRSSSTPNNWLINFNHGFAHLGDKYVLWLRNDPKLHEQAFDGLARCGSAGNYKPGLPKTCSSINVDLDAVLEESGMDSNFTLLKEVVAHELAHGSNVWHHGDSDYTVDSIYETWAPSGRKIQHRGRWSVAAPGGQESGVQECIMKYPGASVYEFPGRPWSWWHGLRLVYGELYPPAEGPGTVFCDSKVGTGVNDPHGGTLPDGRKLPKAGNATLGDCIHQFSVNDLK